jgi:hypothetical protein
MLSPLNIRRHFIPGPPSPDMSAKPKFVTIGVPVFV